MTRSSSIMKIVVMLLSMCALSWSVVSAMEIRLPGLGKLSLQFNLETGTPKVTNSDPASTSEGEPQLEGESTTASDDQSQTDPLQESPKDPKSSEPLKDDKTAKSDQVTTVKPSPEAKEKVTEAGEPKSPAKEGSPEQADSNEKGSEKPKDQAGQPAATQATTVKDSESKEKATAKAEKEPATTEAVDKEAPTEKPSDDQDQDATEAVQTEEPAKEDKDSETDSPESNEKKTEEPSADQATTKKASESKENVTPKAKEDPAAAKAGDDKKETTEKPAGDQKQEVTEASQGAEPTEVDKNENTTPSKPSKPQPATPKPEKQPKSKEETTKKPEDEVADPEEEPAGNPDPSGDDLEADFNDSDIWDDTVDPPEEFGQEYDLDPNQLQDNNATGSDMDDRFAPKLQLPFDLLRDMFFKPNQSASSESTPAPQSDSFFDRLTTFLNPAKLMDRLDTIPGQIQTMVDGLRQKRSDGLKSLREKLDSMTNAVGKKFGDRFGKGVSAENSQKCLAKIQPAFERYESVLQKGINPCVEKTQHSLRKHDSQIQRMVAASSEALTDVKDCASKMGGSFGEMLKSVISFGSCTSKKMKNKIEHLLGHHLEKLAGVIGKHKENAEAQIKETIQCVENRLHLPKVEKLQEKILDKINCVKH